MRVRVVYCLKAPGSILRGQQRAPTVTVYHLAEPGLLPFLPFFPCPASASSLSQPCTETPKEQSVFR
jgi:hypothetical protein